MDLMSFLIFSLYILLPTHAGASGFLQRKVKFSILHKKNVTGHYATHLTMKQSARDLPEIWKVDVEHEITESEGVKISNLLAVLTVPPQLPADYMLIPGIGYYKFHNEVARSFTDAVESCSKEGGHLAIINSEDESNALKRLFDEHPKTDAFNFDFLYIGLHDRFKEGDFITIFGQPLKYTGFQRWAASHEPNGGSRENCGSLYRNGGLNDIPCVAKLPFICEYDLSWVDV